MAEYIKREAALRCVQRQRGPYRSPAQNQMLDFLKAAVEHIPTADVAPVVHGKWVWHEEEFEYECSACHCRFDYNRTFELFDHGFQYADYCPHCGAEMDGGDNDAAD